MAEDKWCLDLKKSLTQEQSMAIMSFVGWDRLIENLKARQSQIARDSLLETTLFYTTKLSQNFYSDDINSLLHARKPWDAMPEEIPDGFPASTSPENSFTYSILEREENPATASLHPEEQALITLARDREENPATVSRDREENPATGSRDREESPATASEAASQALIILARDREESPVTAIEAASQALITLARDREENPATGSRYREESPATASNAKSIARKYRGVRKCKEGFTAQIEVNHKRIKLGIFGTEMEAAKAYDSTAMKLRKNVPCSEFSMEEELFQGNFDDTSILAMIKDRSYDSKLQEFKKSRSVSGGNLRLCCKELTKTDVSKQVLKIPKFVAPSYFGCEDMAKKVIEIIDEEKQIWPITYCPNDSAFSKGWGNFVRRHKLQEKDKVTFYKQRQDGKILVTVDASARAGEADGADSLCLIAIN